MEKGEQPEQRDLKDPKEYAKIKAERKAKADGKDIKQYELPARKKEVVIPIEGGGNYTFHMKRPTMGQRNDLMEKYKMFDSDKNKDIMKDGTKVMAYSKDTIRLVVQKAFENNPDGKGHEMDISAPDPKSGDPDPLDTMDGALFEVLNAECNLMMGLGETDRYFRYKSSAEGQETSLYGDLQSVQPPAPAPKQDS